MADQDWEYRREFEADAGLLDQERIYLVCNGLDTLAEVFLNGQSLGQTNNMFCQYRWEVKKLLQAGTNTLQVLFSSPVAFIKARQAARPLPTLMNGGMAHLRKVQSHFGWDWGPSLPTCGIWDEIFLEGCSTAHLEDIHLRQKHYDGRVSLTITTVYEQWSAGNLSLEVTVTAPEMAAGMVAATRLRARDRAGASRQRTATSDDWP